ncbi:MAG TPA: hypothetical protein VMB77_02065 [Syntrophales bacterium]|nr:hypothetical protein [Syntrophales bacterium]
MKKLSKLFSQLIEASQNGNGSNHILSSFCSKLERMGYDVSVDGRRIDSNDLDSGKYPELEKLLGSAHFFSLFKNGIAKCEYFVEFPGPDLD